ncbi:MAG: prolipoprotein diacylglyceryl transferase [Firmicutes bacterium]|nr:prolipoprotein diacylglyceryl transferase [Bacillota bacterium]
MLPFIVLFGREIPMYSICCTAGVGLAVLISVLRAKKYETPRHDVFFMCLYMIIGLVIGAKLLYLITAIPQIVATWDDIRANPAILLDYVRGGFVFYGALLGGLGGMAIYCKQYRFRFLRMAEICVPTVPLAQAFGRVGCFSAGCCYGEPYSGPLSVTFTRSLAAPNGVPLLPIQLIEAAGNLIIFLSLMFFGRKRPRDGALTGAYLLAYAAMRFILEFFRGDAVRGFLFGLSTSQWISILMFPAGLWLLLRRGRPGAGAAKGDSA